MYERKEAIRLSMDIEVSTHVFSILYCETHNTVNTTNYFWNVYYSSTNQTQLFLECVLFLDQSDAIISGMCIIPRPIRRVCNR